MTHLTPHDLTMVLLALAVLLGVARLLGEVARWLGQPSVLGEITAGILLGPTVLGRVAPELKAALFPPEGPVAIALEAFFALAVVLFLLVAGLEVDLSVAFRQGKTALGVGGGGMLLPFILGFAVAWFAPGLLMDVPEDRKLVFALFFATALCISALPVVVKILKDLNLIKTEVGVVVISSAIVNDLLGWMIFALVLGMMGAAKGSFDLTTVVILTLLFVGFILTVGRWLVHRLLPVLQARLSWPAGVLGFTLSVALVCAAFTEWIGIHAIFGAFLFGVALGDSRHLRQRTRATLDHFISFTFAPLFFASIGLSVDFIGNFDLVPVVVVFVLACFGKIVGCAIGGMLGGLSKRESWAVGCAKNARGAMEIILGLLALQYGLIDERLFVALVIMALLTSMISGALVQRVLAIRKSVQLAEYMSPARMIWDLPARDRRGAIDQLVEIACKRDAKLDEEAVCRAAWRRELVMPTGMENQIAIPHARIEGLARPVIAVGRSRDGIDFDAIDGRRARLIFLLLTAKDKPEEQLEILSGISALSRNQKNIDRLIEAESPTEFVALLNSEAGVTERDH